MTLFKSLFKTGQSLYVLPDDGLRVVCEQHGAMHEVWLCGRIDIESAPDLGKLLLNRLGLPACRTLIVNSEGVIYIDVAGIATLLEALKAARLRGKQLVLKGLQEKPRYLFEVTRLLHLFDGNVDIAAGTNPVSTRTP